MRLKTFGGLWLEGLSGPATLRPRELGLLALVAAAARKGISRDRLIGILWPETGEESARHTLSQMLYRLRRETGHDAILGTTSLRLDPAVSSDVADLREALAGGDLERVAQLYSGPFLEGFYLPGASEFERWVEEERADLSRAALGALERLAGAADESSGRADAARYWRRLAELDSLSARYASGHMRALAAAGDRSGALARAKLHREAVRRELDAEPDAAVQMLEQSLRIVPPVPAEPAPGTVTARPGPPETTHPPQLAPTSVPTAAATQPKRFGAVMVAGLAGAVLLALLIRSLAAPSDKPAALPFLAVGEITTPELADTNRYGRVLRDMLSTSLGGVEGLQVVANSRLVELLPRGTLTAGAANDAARRAGATEVIEGELSTGSGGLVLSLRRVALSNGIVRKGYMIRAADRYALMDSAGAAIARDLGRLPPSVAITEIRTSSPAAYALYEEGLRANYSYDAPAAYRLMKAALERDSGFAMAAYYVWQLSRNFADESTQTASMARAQRLANRSIERERLLIQGSIAEVDAPLQQALAIAETLTVKYPGDPEGQILLGGIEERAGNWSAAGKAYQRAVTLDSTAGNLRGPYCRICTAIYGMARAYTWWDSAAAAERTARRLVALRPGEPVQWNGLVEPLLREGNRAEALAAYQRSNLAGPAASSDPVFYRDEIRWGRYQAADAALREDAAGSNEGLRREAWWLLMLSLRDQGRLREADSVRRVWQAADQGRGTRPNPAPDALMIGMELGHPEISIRSMRHDAERTARSNDPPGIRNRYLVWFLSLAGTAYAAAGDTAVLRRLADSVETLGETSQFGRDARLHYFLRGLLLQREGRHAEAVDAFQRSLFSLTDGYTRINLMMARSLLELHRAGEAIAVLRPAIRGGVDGSNTYTSRTELHEAMALAFEQAGQADSARVHWRAVESAWRLADPVFRNRYLAAKQRAEL